MINIALADGHSPGMKALKEVLLAEPDFQVVAQAGDGLEAVGAVEKFKPDVLVLDLRIEGLNGIRIIQHLSVKSAGMGIVVRTLHGDEPLVLHALRCGARAFILKNSPDQELVHAIREVSAGRRYLCSRLNQNAIKAYIESTAVTKDPYDALSLREKEVFHLAVEGNSNAEIAALLNISQRTVETHRFNLVRKLGIAPSELMAFAVAMGIISGNKESQALPASDRRLLI